MASQKVSKFCRDHMTVPHIRRMHGNLARNRRILVEAEKPVICLWEFIYSLIVGTIAVATDEWRRGYIGSSGCTQELGRQPPVLLLTKRLERQPYFNKSDAPGTTTESRLGQTPACSGWNLPPPYNGAHRDSTWSYGRTFLTVACYWLPFVGSEPVQDCQNGADCHSWVAEERQMDY